MSKEEIQKRLEEIGVQNLSALSDEETLALLLERKKLQAALFELEKQEEEKTASFAKKEELEKKLKELNQNIDPGHSDDELLKLVSERQAIEAELEKLAGVKKPETLQAAPQESPRSSVVSEPEPTAPVEPEPQIPPEIAKEELSVPDTIQEEPPVEKDESLLGQITIETHGSESIETSALDREEYQGYLRDLQANVNDLGSFLQGLPARVRQSKTFMLEVAKIDPAYAMHYADKESLAQDEHFAIQVAGMQNKRNTGNPLSEMLPQVRTEKVVLAGVKQDYRNVRFVKPEMGNYEEIISIAKKGALEAVAALKGSHDIRLLIPPILQKDKAFMAEVEVKAKQNGVTT